MTFLEKEYHGYNGPIKVHPVGETTKISKAFIDAGKEIGYKEIDVSGREHEGCDNSNNKFKTKILKWFKGKVPSIDILIVFKFLLASSS